ncbi:MAG: hypothetical protein PW788_03480 [Micavibrio sp.]|nr:hypothetical protein [Micavibrio sp.]
MKRSLKTFIIYAVFAIGALAVQPAAAQYGQYYTVAPAYNSPANSPAYNLGYNAARPTTRFAGVGVRGFAPYYQQCVTNADCAALMPQCESSLTLQGKSPQASQCAQAQNYSTGRALCVSGFCSFPQARNTYAQPQYGNPNYCETGNDCALVTDSCGRQTATNNTFAAQRQTSASSQPCASPRSTQAVKELSCQHNQCTVLFDNYPRQ